MDYENPFSAVNPSSFAGNPGGPGFVNQWETSVATEKAEMAKPFIANALKNSNLELQKKGMEVGEASSPEAVALRKKKMELESAESDAKLAILPQQQKNDLKKAEEDFRALSTGAETDAKIAQARQIAADAKGKPVMDFMKSAADYAQSYNDPSNKGVPALQKGFDYSRFVENFKASHPGVEIPPNMQTWSPDLAKYLAGARYVALHSVAQENAMELEKEKTKSAEKVEGMRAGATVGAAKITAEQSGKNAELVAGSKTERNQAALGEKLVAAEAKARDSLEYMRAGQNLPEAQRTPENITAARQAILDNVKQRTIQNHHEIMGTSPGNGGIESKVRASGYEFEPDKFDYRVLANGVVQRKPKGQ